MDRDQLLYRQLQAGTCAVTIGTRTESGAGPQLIADVPIGLRYRIPAIT